MTRDQARSRWGIPIVVVVALVLGAGLWVIQGGAMRTGASLGEEVLRRGTASVIDCRRAVSTMFLDYTCAAEITWDGDGQLPRDVRAAEPPHRVWSTTAIDGEHEVVSHRQRKATRGGSDRETITTVDHPAGTSQGWVVVAYLAMIALPILAGVGTHRILVALGIAPEPRKRSSRGRARN